MTNERQRTEWTCPSCGCGAGRPDAGYCPRCGEQRLDGSTRMLFSPWQRWKHSLWTLLRHPGMLTADWRDGRRRAQIAPLSLFLAINVVFFVTQSLSGLSVVSIPLQAHLHDQPHADLANQQLERRLEKLHVDRDRFADRFDLQQQTLAKASVIALAVPMALTCALLLWRRRESWATHWVFALHFHAYAMAFLVVFFALLGSVLHLYTLLHWTLKASTFEALVSTIQAGVLGSYLYAAGWRVYAVRGTAGVLLSAALVATLTGALYAHRLAVFVVTLFTV